MFSYNVSLVSSLSIDIEKKYLTDERFIGAYRELIFFSFFKICIYAFLGEMPKFAASFRSLSFTRWPFYLAASPLRRRQNDRALENYFKYFSTIPIELDES